MRDSARVTTQLLFGAKPGAFRHIQAQSAPVPSRRRRAIIWSLLVLVMLWWQAAAGQSAHALGTDNTDVLPDSAIAISGGGPWIADPAFTFGPKRLDQPDDLPGLVRERTGSITKQAALAAVAQRAKEQQILWRHSGQRADLGPWFHATQDKKHAAMTGRGQFFIMLLAFLVMSGVTAVLWRQSGALIAAKKPSRRLQHRLR